MASETVKIEISQSLIEELFSSAGLVPPSKVDDKSISELVTVIKKLTSKSRKIDSLDKVETDLDKGQKSILVVDDLGLVVYQLSLLLTKNGYNVMLARSAAEASLLFEEKGPFDFVLMDLFMPNKEDGISLLHKIKALMSENALKTKIIVMSRLPIRRL